MRMRCNMQFTDQSDALKYLERLSMQGKDCEMVRKDGYFIVREVKR